MCHVFVVSDLCVCMSCAPGVSGCMHHFSVWTRGSWVFNDPVPTCSSVLLIIQFKVESILWTTSRLYVGRAPATLRIKGLTESVTTSANCRFWWQRTIPVCVDCGSLFATSAAIVTTLEIVQHIQQYFSHACVNRVLTSKAKHPFSCNLQHENLNERRRHNWWPRHCASHPRFSWINVN